MNPVIGRREGWSRRSLVAAMVAATMLPATHIAAQESTPVVAMNRKRARWYPAPPRFGRLDLNSATLREFIDIPGVWPAQARGFVEHRPYASIVEYRERIGEHESAGKVTTWEAWLYVPVDPNTADVPTLMQMPGVAVDVAIALMAARPYPGVAVFLEALGAISAAPDEIAVAAHFLVADVPAPVATPIAAADAVGPA